jgi:phage terminase large subunit GpA-like protein
MVAVMINLTDRYQHGYAWWLANNHHVTHRGNSMDFSKHPYQIDIIQDQSQLRVIKKSTQCGVSEIEINDALAKVDNGRSVFWVFPDQVLRNGFVKERIDPVLSSSPYYRKLVARAKKRVVEIGGKTASADVSLKQIGRGTIALVGSNSRAGFRSFVADDAIVDEVDECEQVNLPLVDGRLGHSNYRTKLHVGNPSIQGYGIDVLYKESDRKKWFVSCGHCNYQQVLDWFKNVVIEVAEGVYELRNKQFQVVCHKCARPINKTNGEWVAEYPDKEVSGYHISQLFSGTIPITELWEKFQKALADESKMQAFYNDVLGLAYTSKGAKLTEAILEYAVGDYGKCTKHPGPTYMGVDVGKVYNVEIRTKDNRVIYIDAFPDTKQLDELMVKFSVDCCVIDGLPETRTATEFAERHSGKVFLCYYTDNDKLPEFDVQPEKMMVTAHRTQSLDASHSDIVLKKVSFYRGALSIPDWVDQMTAPTRVQEERLVNKVVVLRYAWREGDQADHYRHANNYGSLALKVDQLIGTPMLRFV